jgi:hypothetical protein
MVTVCGKSVKGNPALVTKRTLVSKRTLDCNSKLKQRIAGGVGSMAVCAQGAPGVSGATRSGRAGEPQAYGAIEA